MNKIKLKITNGGKIKMKYHGTLYNLYDEIEKFKNTFGVCNNWYINTEVYVLGKRKIKTNFRGLKHLKEKNNIVKYINWNEEQNYIRIWITY